MLAQHIQPTLDPAADRIATPVHHSIDEVLGLVLVLGCQHRVEHFPTGAHQRVFAGTADDHHHHEHREHRCQRQPEKARRHHHRHGHQQHTHAKLLRNAAGEKELGEDRKGLHHGIDQAKHLGLAGAVAEGLCHQPCLFEIKERADTGQQHHEHGDPQQIGRLQNRGGAGEWIAAQRF
ncbi:hypothetical protein D3C75_937950 [compost metagenome]